MSTPVQSTPPPTNPAQGQSPGPTQTPVQPQPQSQPQTQAQAQTQAQVQTQAQTQAQTKTQTSQTPPAQSQPAPPPIPATVATASPGVQAQLIPGATLQGRVAPPQTAQNAPTPTSASGTVTLTLPGGTARLQIAGGAAPPPTGATVAVRVAAAGPPIQVVLQQAAGPAQGAGAAPTVVTSLSLGQAITATVLSPVAAAPSGQTVPSGAPPPQVGQAATSQVAPTQTQSGQVSGGASVLGAAGAGAAPLPAVQQLAQAQTGATVQVRLLSIAEPGAPPPGAPASNVLSGVVVSAAAGPGAAAIRTPAGLLSVPTSGLLPPGATVLLELLGAPVSPAGPGPSPAAVRPFDALREALALAQQGDPGGVRQPLQALIPSAGPQLGTSLIFFLHAMRLGGVERWLGGDAARGLEALRRGLPGRLDREFAVRTGRARDAAGGEWRSFALPVQNQAEIEPLRLYLKDENRRGDAEDPSDEPARRFVIEVTFSRTGPMQLDTLVREKHIDLMLRTHEGLPDDMRKDIGALYATTLETMGHTGSIDFHVVKQFGFAAISSDGPSDGLSDKSGSVTVTI